MLLSLADISDKKHLFGMLVPVSRIYRILLDPLAGAFA